MNIASVASITGDKKIYQCHMIKRSSGPMEKGPINFYHGAAFTAQMW